MFSIVIPAFNEEQRIPATLRAVREHYDARQEPYEVIVVDDGSTDNTVDSVRTLTHGWPQLRLIACPTNKGKGGVVRVGMLEAVGDERAFMDADLSTPLADLDILRSKLGTEFQIAIASRGLKESSIRVHQPWYRELMGRTYNLLVRLIILPEFHDTQCGCKVYSTTAALTCFTDLKIERFGFDVECIVRAKRAGLGIIEVPVHWSHVEASHVSSTVDSVKMFIDLLKVRFSKNP